jgi:hypothetical protein
VNNECNTHRRVNTARPPSSVAAAEREGEQRRHAGGGRGEQRPPAEDELRAERSLRGAARVPRLQRQRRRGRHAFSSSAANQKPAGSHSVAVE